MADVWIRILISVKKFNSQKHNRCDVTGGKEEIIISILTYSLRVERIERDVNTTMDVINNFKAKTVNDVIELRRLHDGEVSVVEWALKQQALCSMNM